MSVLLLIVYVPTESSQSLKQALFAAGAGKIGNYDCCSWQVEGRGQFRPLEGAQPYQGDIDRVESVPETRVEMMVPLENKAAVQEALHQAHPYETPAYFWVATMNEID